MIGRSEYKAAVAEYELVMGSPRPSPREILNVLIASLGTNPPEWNIPLGWDERWSKI